MASFITSILSGLQGRSAATNAAKELEEAVRAGAGRLESDYPAANEDIVNAANEAADFVRPAAYEHAEDIAGATGEAKDLLQQGTTDANQVFDTAYSDIQDLNKPFSEAGTGSLQQLVELLSPGGEFNKQFSAADMETDPGYQFRLDEGQKVLERSKAAKGAFRSGSTLKALTEYGQNMGSQEYQRSFDRARTEKLDRFGMLSDLTGFGERAAGRNQTGAQWSAGNIGSNIVRGSEGEADLTYRGQLAETGLESDADRYYADTRLGAAFDAAGNKMRLADIIANLQGDIGNAKASGHVGRANAWTNMLDGIGQAGDSFLAGGFQSGKWNTGDAFGSDMVPMGDLIRRSRRPPDGYEPVKRNY